MSQRRKSARNDIKLRNESSNHFKPLTDTRKSSLITGVRLTFALKAFCAAAAWGHECWSSKGATRFAFWHEAVLEGDSVRKTTKCSSESLRWSCCYCCWTNKCIWVYRKCQPDWSLPLDWVALMHQLRRVYQVVAGAHRAHGRREHREGIQGSRCHGSCYRRHASRREVIVAATHDESDGVAVPVVLARRRFLAVALAQKFIDIGEKTFNKRSSCSIEMLSTKKVSNNRTNYVITFMGDTHRNNKKIKK